MSLASKFGLQLLIIFAGLIPFWIFLAVRGMLGPSGFFENILMFILGWLVLGGAQLFCACIALMLSLSLWDD